LDGALAGALAGAFAGAFDEEDDEDDEDEAAGGAAAGAERKASTRSLFSGSPAKSTPRACSAALSSLTLIDSNETDEYDMVRGAGGGRKPLRR